MPFQARKKSEGSAISNQNYRINDRIRIREVRLIDEEGNNLGIKPTREAREYAISKGLDLVEVAPDARPPVCRVMDYGKFMYEQTKKERAAKKSQKQVEIKGIRIRPDTDSYHIGFKIKQARGFLRKGNKVRISCHFRGRERSHPEIARTLMKEVADQLGDIATVEQTPNFEGRNMTMLLAPTAAAAAAAAAASEKLAADKVPAGSPSLASPDALGPVAPKAPNPEMEDDEEELDDIEEMDDEDDFDESDDEDELDGDADESDEE